MKKEHDQQLCSEFPELYADRNADVRTTCMCWGFECGDGWFKIIYDLSKKLTELIRALPSVDHCCFRASQVKEKFGTLRFYMTCETDEMTAAIDEAVELSEKTCELCGQPGELRNESWIVVKCDDCNKKPCGN